MFAKIPPLLGFTSKQMRKIPAQAIHPISLNHLKRPVSIQNDVFVNRKATDLNFGRPPRQRPPTGQAQQYTFLDDNPTRSLEEKKQGRQVGRRQITTKYYQDMREAIQTGTTLPGTASLQTFTLTNEGLIPLPPTEIGEKRKLPQQAEERTKRKNVTKKATMNADTDTAEASLYNLIGKPHQEEQPWTQQAASSMTGILEKDVLESLFEDEVLEASSKLPLPSNIRDEYADNFSDTEVLSSFGDFSPQTSITQKSLFSSPLGEQQTDYSTSFSPQYIELTNTGHLQRINTNTPYSAITLSHPYSSPQQIAYPQQQAAWSSYPAQVMEPTPYGQYDPTSFLPQQIQPTNFHPQQQVGYNSSETATPLWSQIQEYPIRTNPPGSNEGFVTLPPEMNMGIPPLLQDPFQRTSTYGQTNVGFAPLDSQAPMGSQNVVSPLPPPKKVTTPKDVKDIIEKHYKNSSFYCDDVEELLRKDGFVNEYSVVILREKLAKPDSEHYLEGLTRDRKTRLLYHYCPPE